MGLNEHHEERDYSSQEVRVLRATLDASKRARAQTVSDLQRIDESFQLLVHSIKDYAIFTLDPQGCILNWNEGARRLKGYEESEILGRHFSIFYTPEDATAGLPGKLLDLAAREGRCEHEGWRVRKDGTWFWADVVITALRDCDGRLIGYGKVTRDLTERRRAIEERMHLQEERLARQTAEQSVRLRDEFLGVAAHELKTPVTSLRLQAQLMARRLTAGGTIDPASVTRALTVIDEQSHKLADLMNKLLDVSRVSNGRLALDREEADVVPIVSNVVERLRALLPNRRFVVEGPESLVAVVDPLRLEQVVTNLLDNAAKYGADGPIETTLSQLDPAYLRISVRDYGSGVPEGQREHLFDRFYQAESHNHRVGMGLGLYISKQIVELHGGDLTAEFPSDGGSRFVVSIPVR